MNEERAGGEGSSRGSGGSRGETSGFDGSSGFEGEGSVSVPRQGEQGQGGPGEGVGRRRAGAAELDVTELAAALERSVAAIGAAGPPRAGLARIRRRAKARQRRRTMMASSAGVLLLGMVVGAVTGSSFNIVPVLTSVVGLGDGSTSSGAPTASPQAGGGQVRTVRPSAAVAGKKGPAIGPVLPTATPTALAATGVAQCTAANLKTTTSVDSVIGGVSYGHVEAVATATCAVAGPPVLQVENVAGTAVSSVVILRHESSDGSQLPNVATWGAVLKLQAGQGYEFQFAWAQDACTGSSAGGATGAAGTAGTAATGGASPGVHSGATGAAGQSAETAYSLSYLVAGVTPTAPVDLDASCGATVYVTDVYGQGAYPLPQPPTSPTAQAPTSSAPAPSQSPTTQPPASGVPSSTDTTPVSPSSSTAATSASTATNSAATNAANATVVPSSS